MSSAQQMLPANEDKNLRIVFMGTPEFAVASLDALISNGYRVVGVVTAPDKPAGRGMKLSASAVKKYALEKGLKILQPVKLKDPSFLNELESLHADLQIVVAFRMLPEVVWNMPPMGTVNVHGSLLPRYRGAAPINWAIINGEKETGVTTFKLQHEIDTGNILLQQTIPIGAEETAGELHDRMKDIGAELLIQTVKGLAAGAIEEIQQPGVPGSGADGSHASVSFSSAPKIFTETCRIDWEKPVNEIHNLIRGLSPFPGAYTELNGKKLKIFKTKKLLDPSHLPPGQYESDGKNYLRFSASDGAIEVRELQLEGKKRMAIEDFLRGNKVM
ncbi:MAG: methionyl-tRNA formyltransferase [Chitinophagaceae bacterium]|nr:methionyl-tRNA formyltransferase [Chitinophagaceae bacterium]